MKNEITGNELPALKKDGLTMMGITWRGALCLLLEEIEMLKKASQCIVTLIKYSLYCSDKICLQFVICKIIGLREWSSTISLVTVQSEFWIDIVHKFDSWVWMREQMVRHIGRSRGVNSLICMQGHYDETLGRVEGSILLGRPLCS